MEQPATIQRPIVPANRKVHFLKSWPGQFRPVLFGQKTAEYRRNDRNYQVDDLLSLEEWDPLVPGATGRMVMVQDTHIAHGPEFDIPQGYCVLSIKKVF